jgi:hypothetical protein
MMMGKGIAGVPPRGEKNYEELEEVDESATEDPE